MATHRPILSLGLRDQGRPLDADDYAEADLAPPWRYERADGRLRVLAPPGEDHIRTQHPWLKRLLAYESARPDVVDIVVPEAWIRLDGATDRIADLAVYLVAVAQDVKIPARVPDLVLEIVSPGLASSDRDYLLMCEQYQRIGVREYVIVDRFERTVTVLTHAADGYRDRVLSVEHIYESELLPGLAIPLSEIF